MKGLPERWRATQGKIVSWNPRPENQERDISGQGQTLQGRVIYFLLKKLPSKGNDDTCNSYMPVSKDSGKNQVATMHTVVTEMTYMYI